AIEPSALVPRTRFVAPRRSEATVTVGYAHPGTRVAPVAPPCVPLAALTSDAPPRLRRHGPAEEHRSRLRRVTCPRLSPLTSSVTHGQRIGRIGQVRQYYRLHAVRKQPQSL